VLGTAVAVITTDTNIPIGIEGLLQAGERGFLLAINLLFVLVNSVEVKGDLLVLAIRTPNLIS
jgi:hypothetical protein